MLLEYNLRSFKSVNLLKSSLQLIAFTSLFSLTMAQNNPKLVIQYNINNEIVITVNSQLHLNYGFAYPMTYAITIPFNSHQLKAYRRYSENESWSQIQEKTSNDFFNGIEVVRYDYPLNVAYISVAFSSYTDNVCLKIVNQEGNNVPIGYSDICKYYDNRDVVVTTTADDWDKYSIDQFNQAINLFRAHNLWLSCGVITDTLDWMDQPSAWQEIQKQLDSGYVEVLAHSRTHSHLPYNYNSEIVGSKQDIIRKLNLPSLFRNNEKEYIYAYVDPYGEYNDSVDYVAGYANYLVTRDVQTNLYDFSYWNQNKNIYEGSHLAGDADDQLSILNQRFDFALQNHKVYHFYFHPWSMDGLWTLLSEHLDYISNRKNVWYTAFGLLYLYHFLEDGDYAPIVIPGLTITPTAQNVGYKADSTKFTMVSNVNWVVTDDVEWLTVSQDSDSGNGTITVMCSVNTDITQRIGKITVNGGGITDTITIIQAAHPYELTVIPTAQNVGYKADSTKFTLVSNANWVVTDDVEWLTVSPDSSSGNGTITVMYSVNTDTTQRVGKITVNGGGITDTITIIQAAHPNELTVTPTVQNVGFTEDSTKFTVVSNTNWVVTDDVEWLTISPDSSSGNGTITVTYTANLGTTPRIGSLTISWGDSTIVVTITQAGLFIHLSSKIFLEGAYNSNSGLMNTTIEDFIPTTSPYTQDARTVSVIPPDVVDWVLVEFRTTDSSSAIISKSVFLNKDGYLVSDDGSAQILLGVVPGSYYVVIRHRNHLAVMSSNSIPTVNDTLTYDFTVGSERFYGGSDGAKEVKEGVWGMITGDGDGNGQIQNNDSEEIWKPENGTSGYKNGDYNMNNQVQNDDNENYWKTNNGKGSLVPNL